MTKAYTPNPVLAGLGHRPHQVSVLFHSGSKAALIQAQAYKSKALQLNISLAGFGGRPHQVSVLFHSSSQAP